MKASTFNGLPCKKCGQTLRYQTEKRCVQCRTNQRQSEKQKLYQQQYHKIHQDKLNVYQNEYHKTEKHKLWVKKYVKQPSRKLYKQKYRLTPTGKAYEQKEETKKRQKTLRQSPKGKDVHNVSQQKRRARIRQIEGSYTTQEWIDLKEQCGNRCLCCHKHQSELDRPLEQDHIIPITKPGSTNWITNIQPLCRNCNGMGEKGTKIIDYRQN